MKWDYVTPEEFDSVGPGLFVVCEGNFQYGNASLTFYDPADGEAQQEVFLRANGYKLGDVAQSMTVHGDTGWIVVNNSHVIFAIDTGTFREKGRVEGLPSPRYIHFVSDDKAYVTQLWDNRIFIVNPRTCEVTGTITVPGMAQETGSTEQMVQIGTSVYAACWSYQDRIIKIDTETDCVTADLRVGVQPRSLAADCHGKLWVLTDGGSYGNPAGYETPRIMRIDPASLTVEREFELQPGDSPSRLQTDSSGATLYWLNGGVWRMAVTADALPADPLIASRGTIYYGLTVSPTDGDIYVADAIDYQQPGRVYRYDPAGNCLSYFTAGVIPADFAWKTR